MKRREMIKAASTFAVAPLLFPGSIPSFNSDSAISQEMAKVRRFGDSRDWFFEKRYGMFIHWAYIQFLPGMNSTSGVPVYRVQNM